MVGDDRQQLLETLRQQIQQLNKPLPPSFPNYCINVASSGSFDVQRTDPANLDDVLTRWELPEQVRQFLSNLKFAEEAEHHSLSFVVAN